MNVYYDKKRGTYYVKVTKDGVTHFKRGFATEKEAVIECSKFLLTPKQFKQKHNLLRFEDINTFFYDYMCNSYRATSVYRYMSILRKYIYPFFNCIIISKLTNAVLDKYIKHIKSLAYRDKHNILFMTRLYMKFAADYGLSESVDINRIYLRKNSLFFTKKKFDFYTNDEYTAFRSHISDPIMMLIFDLLFYYGLRISELRGLTHSDINLKLKYIDINKTLSNKTASKKAIIMPVKTSNSLRTLPLSESTISLYSSLFKRPNHKSFIFLSGVRDNKVIGESTIKRYQVLTCSKCSLRVIKIHEFRHSCATNLIFNNFRAHDVAAWLGHSVTMTLDTYSHFFPDAKRNIADFINKQ